MAVDLATKPPSNETTGDKTNHSPGSAQDQARERLSQEFLHGMFPIGEYLINASNRYLGTDLNPEWFAKSKNESFAGQLAHDVGEMIPTTAALVLADLAVKTFAPPQMRLVYGLASSLLGKSERLAGLEAAAPGTLAGNFAGLSSRTLALAGRGLRGYGDSLVGAGLGRRANEFLLQGTAVSLLTDPSEFPKNFLMAPVEGQVMKELLNHSIPYRWTAQWSADLARVGPMTPNQLSKFFQGAQQRPFRAAADSFFAASPIIPTWMNGRFGYMIGTNLTGLGVISGGITGVADAEIDSLWHKGRFADTHELLDGIGSGMITGGTVGFYQMYKPAGRALLERLKMSLNKPDVVPSFAYGLVS